MNDIRIKKMYYKNKKLNIFQNIFKKKKIFKNLI